jgi:hypothetical protein
LGYLRLSSPDDIAEHDPSYNRWKQAPAAVAVHMSLGSVFAFSIFNTPLTTALGVVAASPGDWLLSDLMPVFGTTMSFFGIGAAIFGRTNFYEKVGPRVCTLLGASSYACGFAVGSLGVHLHSLPLLTLGYGAMGGLAMGVS